MDYQPKIDDVITLYLPDESTRAKIVKLVSRTHAIAELQTYTTSKSHNYRKGSFVPCRFGKINMGLTGWTAIDEEELQRGAKPEEVVPEENDVRQMTHADIFGPAERKAKAKPDVAQAR